MADKGDVRPSSEGFWDYLLNRGKIVWATGPDHVHIFKGNNPNAGRAWIAMRARVGGISVSVTPVDA